LEVVLVQSTTLYGADMFCGDATMWRWYLRIARDKRQPDNTPPLSAFPYVHSLP
jgi:hypothetical protein